MRTSGRWHTPANADFASGPLSMSKLIILDRDGVINFDSPHFIKNPDEWKPIPGSLEAIAALSHGGYRVVVASNQSGVGRGLFDMAMLNAINEKMMRAVQQFGGRIDAIFYCPHSPDAGCECRKPKTAMVREIGERFGTDLAGVPMIGDALRDLQCASEVGAQPILVRTGKGEAVFQAGQYPPTTRVYQDLSDAAQALISARP